MPSGSPSASPTGSPSSAPIIARGVVTLVGYNQQLPASSQPHNSTMFRDMFRHAIAERAGVPAEFVEVEHVSNRPDVAVPFKVDMAQVVASVDRARSDWRWRWARRWCGPRRC